MGIQIPIISLQHLLSVGTLWEYSLPFSACVCGREALFTPVLPLEAVLADKRSEGGSFMHPSSPPPGLRPAPSPGQGGL